MRGVKSLFSGVLGESEQYVYVSEEESASRWIPFFNESLSSRNLRFVV